MSSTIWKFPLPIQDTARIMMPEGARILTAMVQDGLPYVWAIVDPHAEPEMRKLYVRGTGHLLGTVAGCEYVGCVMLHGDTFVGHVFAAGQS